MTNVFTSNNFRAAAATAPAFVAAASFVVAEASTKVAKKVAGKEGWEKTPFHGMIDAHTKGFVFNVPDSKELLKKAVESKEEEEKKEEGVTDPMGTWKKTHWVPSEKAEEEAKKKGYKEAILAHRLKLANWVYKCGKQGADKVYSTPDGTQSHTYAFWAMRTLNNYVESLKKYQKNVDISQLWEKACGLSHLKKEDIPTLESIKVVMAAELKAAGINKPEDVKKVEAEKQTKEEAAEERISVEEGREILAEVEAEEERDGRAPKTVPVVEESKIKVMEVIHTKVGVPRLNKNNCYITAEKARSCFEAGKISKEEFHAVVERCMAKDGGDPEEFYALMGEN